MSKKWSEVFGALPWHERWMARLLAKWEMFKLRLRR